MARLKVVSFKIQLDLLEQLDKYAMKYGVERSVAIRLALQKLLEEEQKNEANIKIRIEKGQKIRQK